MYTAVYKTMTSSVPPIRNADASRARILAAAQHLFATRGYASTGIRDIARAADVNSALVGRYFGTKLQMFSAALDALLDISPLLVTPDRGDFGRHAVRLLVGADGGGPLATMMLSMSDPQAREVSVGLFQEKVIAPLAGWLGEPDAQGRAARLNILWSGFLNCWRLLPLPAMGDEKIGFTLAWLERSTQAIVDETGPLA